MKLRAFIAAAVLLAVALAFDTHLSAQMNESKPPEERSVRPRSMNAT